MNEMRRSDIDKYLLGVTLIVALIFGGGTMAGLVTDTFIQLISIVTSSFVIIRNMDRAIDGRVFWLLVGIAAIIIFQMLPISIELIRSTQGILPSKGQSVLPNIASPSISLGLGRTIEVFAYFMTLVLFVVAVMKLRFEQAFSLIPFFLAGVVVNMTAGLVQYSFSARAVVTGIFPYDILAGFFANDNHFANLVFISIPLAFSYFLETRRFFILCIYLAFSLLILLAAGSTAGILIGITITALSATVLLQRNQMGILSVMGGSIIVGIYSVGLWARIQAENWRPEDGRAEFARTTLEGVLDNLPFGIGYGNFVFGYPSYEKSNMIFYSYVNHAHNEYLELLFEGGAIAAIGMMAFAIVFVWRVAETVRWPLHKAVALSILFVLVHSVVDYPLRTLAIAFPFALFLGLLFHRGPERQDRDPAGDVLVPLNGEMIVVPMTGK
jgi:hypothetical protein